MTELFGLPIDTLMWIFSVSLIGIIVWCAFLVLRQPVLFRLAARNIPRRWGRSLLIVLGLTLATTIIAAAFATGDTVSTTARADVLRSLGNVDEVVSSRELKETPLISEQSRLEYFDEASFPKVQAWLSSSPDVDGVMPAIWEQIGVQNLTSRQTEPRVQVLAADARYMKGFGTIRDGDGKAIDLAAVSPDSVLLNQKAAKELHASAGDELLLFAAGRQMPVRVQDIVDYDGIGTTDSGLIMPLAAGQILLGKTGLIQHIMISNKGGVGRSDAAIHAAQPVLDDLSLAIDATKRDQLKSADAAGAAFSTFFVTFGSFSIAAGILLIFLLFVMLAGERRPEMGMARAVGTERLHLVEMFMLEGLLYDMLAAAVGALAGIGVAYAMVTMLSSALGGLDVTLRFSVSARSLITAYTMGVVLTFIVVTLSAWRVSVLNIVTAIRNLPEPTGKASGRASLIWGAVAIAGGALLTWLGLVEKQATPFYLGVSLLLLSLIPLLRWSGVSDRIAFGLSGALIVAWSIKPTSTFDWLLPEMQTDFNIWITGGLITVTGATWLVIYNSDIILGVVLETLGRVRWLAPILKTAITYPLTNRFRTGVTLAMFTLVVFVLVIAGITTTAFTEAFNDVGMYGGGFEVRANTVPVSPIPDLRAAIESSPGLDRSNIEIIASQSLVSIEAKQDGTTLEFGAYPLRGVDDAFLDNTTYGFSAIAQGYSSASDVWRSLKTDSHLAIVDDLVAPRRTNFNFGEVTPDFRLQGFYIEDGTFKPIPIQVRDPVTGATYSLTVIAVLKDVTPAYMIGVITSQRFVEQAFPTQAAPTGHLLKLRSNADPEAFADGLESAFLANGLEAVVLREELHDLVSLNRTFNYLIQGFVGLGLVVGVAALGVISARSVVERRQEIGVMRAIGFEQNRVQLSFLIESSMVAVAGIVLGTALGLIIAYNVIVDSRKEGSWENLAFTVPWLNLLVIYAVVLFAALLTAFIPARNASKIYPAQALRYE